MKTNAIILGKGAPNRSKDGSAKMCFIALSKEFGLIRAYPLRLNGTEFKIWDNCELEIEKSKQDIRRESYKLEEIKLLSHIDNREYRKQILDSCILKSAEEDPLDYQNQNLASIALVKATVQGVSIDNQDIKSITNPIDSMDSWVVCQSESIYKPMIKWISTQGKYHENHLVSQEAYEWLRKNPLNPFGLFLNYQFVNPEYEIWILLGNMNHRRNIWVIVQVHRIKKNMIGSFIQSCSMMHVGNQKGWPYLNQEEENVKCVEDQMVFKFIT